jgi:hypothetical protein
VETAMRLRRHNLLLATQVLNTFLLVLLAGMLAVLVRDRPALYRDFPGVGSHASGRRLVVSGGVDVSGDVRVTNRVEVTNPQTTTGALGRRPEALVVCVAGTLGFC